MDRPIGVGEVKRPVLNWPAVRMPKVTVSEDAALTGGFFTGLLLIAIAIALYSFPAGLLVGGIETTLVCGLLAKSGGE